MTNIPLPSHKLTSSPTELILESQQSKVTYIILILYTLSLCLQELLVIYHSEDSDNLSSLSTNISLAKLLVYSCDNVLRTLLMDAANGKQESDLVQLILGSHQQERRSTIG